MAAIGFLRPSMIRQNFPPPPKFTDENIPDLSGKVYIVTGSNTGVGKALASILYKANAKVYMACRTESKARQAIEDIRSEAQSSKGGLEYLSLDLADLRSVKSAAEKFKEKENRLDVLFNNAGVGWPPEGSKTAQGYELQLGTNCLGHFLFTQLLTPVLAETAKKGPAGSTRVVWVSSMAAELYSTSGGVKMENLGETGYIQEVTDAWERYGNTKAGDYYYATEYARRHAKDGIISVAVNPGNLDSDLYRYAPATAGLDGLTLKMFAKFMLYPVAYGAATELFGGFSPDVTMERSGAWIGPFGRFFNIRKDLARGAKPTSEGGSGIAQEFWEWSEDRVREFS